MQSLPTRIREPFYTYIRRPTTAPLTRRKEFVGPPVVNAFPRSGAQSCVVYADGTFREKRARNLATASSSGAAKLNATLAFALSTECFASNDAKFVVNLYPCKVLYTAYVYTENIVFFCKP
jgi:hypothetical protein